MKPVQSNTLYYYTGHLRSEADDQCSQIHDSEGKRKTWRQCTALFSKNCTFSLEQFPSCSLAIHKTFSCILNSLNSLPFLFPTLLREHNIRETGGMHMQGAPLLQGTGQIQLNENQHQ